MVGYDELVVLIGNFPELAVFRKFGPLAAKVLLMKQAELLHLQQEFGWMAEDEVKNPATQDLCKSWEKMITATGLGSRRRMKLEEIETKLVSSCEAVSAPRVDVRNVTDLPRHSSQSHGQDLAA